MALAGDTGGPGATLRGHRANFHPTSDSPNIKGYRLFTPAGNRSSVLCFHATLPTADVRAAFEGARIDATVREGHVRFSIALFNNSDDINRALAVTKTLA